MSSLELVLGICSKKTRFALLGLKLWFRDTDELGLGVNGVSTLCACGVLLWPDEFSDLVFELLIELTSIGKQSSASLSPPKSEYSA